MDRGEAGFLCDFRERHGCADHQFLRPAQACAPEKSAGCDAKMAVKQAAKMAGREFTGFGDFPQAQIFMAALVKGVGRAFQKWRMGQLFGRQMAFPPQNFGYNFHHQS